jgi:hypothetical protein
MSDSTWELLPSVGIESGAIRLSFGMERQDLLAAMSSDFLPPEPSDYTDEDDFLKENRSTFIRVRYEGTRVRDIEFLGGTLRYQGIDLHSRTTFDEIERQFETLGFTFRPTEWLGDGADCPKLAINIATREDVGGDGDEIEWVILSSNFR